MQIYVCMEKKRYILIEYKNNEYEIVERESHRLLDALLPYGSKDERIREFLRSRVNPHYVKPGELMKALRLTNGEKFTDRISLEFIDDN